jgi:hypothetical protein
MTRWPTGGHRVDLAEAQRDAVVERLQPQQFVAVRSHEVRDRAQDPAAFAGPGMRPSPRASSSAYGLMDATMAAPLK